MATNLLNRIVRDEHLASSMFESALGVIDNTVTINQGDLICLKSGLLANASAEADGASFLGISRVSLVNGKILSPYQGTAVDGAQAIVDIAGPIYGCVARLSLKAGDTVAPGALVYLNPANGTFSVQAAGTKAIGIYVGYSSITGAVGGSPIEVRLGCRFPSDALIF